MSTPVLNAYRIATIGFSGVLSLLFLSQLFFNLFRLSVLTRAIFGLVLSVLLGLLEFREVGQLDKYASFYYTYPGRGALFALLFGLLDYSGAFSIIVGVLLWPMIGAHAVLSVRPDLGEPAYFKTANIALSTGEDEGDIVWTQRCGQRPCLWLWSISLYTVVYHVPHTTV